MTTRRSGCFPERGMLINAAASAGSARVVAEQMLTACGDRPERIAERTRLRVAVAARRAEEAAARAALEAWEQTDERGVANWTTGMQSGPHL